MARYFRLSDGRKVTADNDGAVRELIKWGVDNKIGVSEYFIYQDPQNKQYEVDAWARERALQHPALKGAVNVGEMGPRTAPDLNKPAQEPQKKQLQQSEPTTNVDLRNVRNTSKAVEYQHPGGGFQEFYSQVQSGKVTAPQVKNIDPAKYTEEQLNKNITEPRLREAYQSWQNRRTETPYQPNSQTRLDKAVSERERIGRDIENLVLARPPDSETELLKNWKISYEGEVDKYNFYTEQIIPYRATGLNAAQRELADSAAKWADKYPALAATVGQLGMGLWGLATSPYNLITAGMGRDNEAYYALRQGISQGLAGEGLWNDVGSGFYSFGLVAPLAIGTALSGGTASPLLAKALGVAGTATMQMSITSDIMRELYQDDNYLSFMEAGAAAVSGAAQQLTENLSLSFQTKALSNAFKLGGQAGLRQATSELVRKAFAPTLGEQAVGLLQTFGTEILEENLQWAEDAVIQNVMLGKPMPTWEETKQAVRDNTIGALFGVVLQSGAMMGVQARQSRTSAQALKALAADESGWTSPKLAQQAIDQLTAGQIGEAAETAQKAHQALISSDAAMDEKAKRHVLKAVGSVYGAANMYDAQTAANVFIEEKAAKKELAALEQEKRKLEKAIPSQQTEDKLFLLNEKIEEADAELVRLQGVITENAQQKAIYDILNEASEAEQKARKAGDKALDKLTDSKAYNEATPEQQRQMMKDAVLSDKKSAKLQEKADQKYREANLYKLRQTPAYKQAAPEVQTQMEEAELQRQQEAIAAEFEAARQKAISEQQEAEKAAETASNEATEEIEVIPDIIDQLEAKKAAIRQERQDINKELTEYRKLMDQQGGWLPSVTPEQKKAYHEVKQRQKEVNRKLNEVGIEIRKEKAAQKKAAAEQQKPKKKAKPKEKKKTEKPQETEAKEQPKKSKKAEAKETKKKEKPETKKEAPQKEKEAESEPEKAPKKAPKKDAEPETKTELPAIEPYTPSARMRGGDKLRTEKFYRLYKLEKLRDAGVKKVMLGSATVGIETAIKRTQNSLGATSQSEYWEWKKKRDTLIDADKIAAEGKVIPDEVLKDYPELQTPETDTRTKSEALQETLPTIPDKTADDALLGMVKSHILSITRKDRTTTVNFKDGRQLVINHITQEAMLTEAGKTGVMYAGRTQGEKGKKNVYKAIVDLVDGLNQGNRTLFHEAFHVVWKLFLSNEQISYIKQYYRVKANKGELVRKYVVTRQGTEMAIYWTKEQFNALNKERQAEALEEGAAYGFEHWLGSRTDTAPTTMIGKLWQRLADAIRHALVKLNLANQNAKLTDIFHAVASDKLTGQGEQGAETRNKVTDAERIVGAHAIINGKHYTGTTHGDTLNQAMKDGEVIIKKDGYYYDKDGSPLWGDGWNDYFITNTGRVLDRFDALSEFGIAGAEDMDEQATRYKPVPTADMGENKTTKSPYRAYLTPFRGDITKPKILSRLKNNNAPKGRIKLFEEIRKFDSAEELSDHIFYHGTTNYIDKGLKPSIAFSDRFVEQSGGGGYGQKYWAISLSKSKNIASNFSGTQSSVTVYPVILRKGANVISMPDIQDAADLDDIIVNLWENEIDAVYIGDPNGGEQELAVLNPKAIYTFDNPDTYAVFGKQRLNNLTPERIAEIYQIAQDRKGAVDRIRELPKEERQGAIRELTGDIRFKPAPTQSEVAEAERQYAEVEAKYKGTAGWLKAPNGKPTNLNERQWVQVRTKAFKDWFGDWENDPKNASKVVDENGEPMVVYHGTSTTDELTFFDPDLLGTNTHARSAEKGFFFSDNRDLTVSYASSKKDISSKIITIEKRLIPILEKSGFQLYADNLKNNKTMRGNSEIFTGYAGEIDWTNDMIDELSTHKSYSQIITQQDIALLGAVRREINRYSDRDIMNVVDVFLNLRSPMLSDHEGKAAWDSDSNGMTQDDLLDKALELNMDGLILKNSQDGMDTTRNGTNYIAFSPTQIKSATANVGTFDQSNPDIRYKVLPNLDKDALIAEAGKHETIDEFIATIFDAPPEYGISHRPSWDGAPPVSNLLDGDMLPRDVYDHPEWSIMGYGYPEAERESWNVIMSVRNQPDKIITVYRAASENSLNIGDWVTLSRLYAKTHSEGHGGGVYSFEVKARDVLFAGDYINEFGYYPKDLLTDIWNEAKNTRYKPVPTAAEVAEAERQYAEVEAKYRGTAQWLKAPNGKPTNLNERQWVQVRTKAFKDWFGDWENDPKNASKVVDENGEPMVVYHGSPSAGFAEFMQSKGGALGPGIYFTDSPTQSGYYSRGGENQAVYPVFLNIKNPAVGYNYDATHNVVDSTDGIIVRPKSGVDAFGENAGEYLVFNKTQIKSAIANVGTFSENPDIRYRKLTERERAMWDDVWNEIMGRPPTLRAQTRPKVQTEPPEKEPQPGPEPQRPQPARPSQSKPPTEAEIDVLSERIGKDLGIAPAQVKEKLGRQMMAAWREAQGDISRLMESAAIRNFEEWVENNKPEGTDSRDLTWHWEEMLEYAAKVGLSREQIAQMVKSDRFDATAIGINLFQRMNYVGKLLVETEATLADRNWGTPAEREQKEAQYGILQAQFDELQAAYAMQGSEAGTVLWTRRQNKAQYLENLTRAAQALESKINRGSLELAEKRQELDGLERTISDLEKSFEMLLRVMDGKRYKDITEMSNAELEAERQKQAERLNDLRNRAEHLRYEIDQKVAAMQADKGRQEETQTQIRKIRKTGRKAKVIEIKERKPDVHDWIRAAWYNSVLAGIPTHMVNMSANVVNSLLEDVATLFTQGGKVAGAQFAEKVRALFSNYEQLDPKTGEKIKTGAFAKAKEEFTSPQEFSKKNEVILKGNKLFMGIQFSTKFLGAEDMLAFFPNERGMLKSLAFDESKRTGRSVADLMENPTSDMLRQAYYEAKRNTFNQNPEGYVGVLIEAINKFYNALDQSGGGGKAIGNLIRFNVMPFTRVLGNVLNATIDYTPLGMIRYFAYKSDNPNSLLNRQRKDQNGRPLWLDENGDRMVSPFKARDARRQAARVALGTILGSLLYFLTMSADDDDEDKWFISGAGPQDYKKYKQLMAAGWRPFSFHIGNVIISYKEWPVSGAFAVIGNLHDIQKYDGKTRPQDWLDKTIYAAMGVASSFLDRSFASNAVSAATALDRGDPKWVERSLTSTTSSIIIPYNNMLRFIENTYNRDLYTPETIAQQAWASVPLVPKKGLPRRVNVFGMYEKKDPATARLAMTDNVGLVVPDTKKTREIFQTVRKNNLFLSETTKREHRVDPYVGKRGIPEEDKQYIWLQGKDHENFRVMRGTEYVRLLNEPQNYNLIMQYDKNKDKDELAALLTSLGRKATAYATEETLKAYQRGELKHKYNTYNKSREEED